jgi:hypothetical protein
MELCPKLCWKKKGAGLGDGHPGLRSSDETERQIKGLGVGDPRKNQRQTVQ